MLKLRIREIQLRRLQLLRRMLAKFLGPGRYRRTISVSSPPGYNDCQKLQISKKSPKNTENTVTTENASQNSQDLEYSSQQSQVTDTGSVVSYEVEKSAQTIIRSPTNLNNSGES